MFKDYYQILGVSEIASYEEIKVAFKNQALKWHPDRNRGVDTTPQMQELNEAYLILKDSDARARYNLEYQKYKEYIRQKEQGWQYSTHNNSGYRDQANKRERQEDTYQSAEYKVVDDLLRKWMDNASRQAVDLAKQTVEDLKGMTKAGVKAAANDVSSVLKFQFGCLAIVGVVVIIVALFNALIE